MVIPKPCFIIATLALLVLVATACAPEGTPTTSLPVAPPSPSSHPTASPAEKPLPSSSPTDTPSEEPVLSASLKRGCTTAKGGFDNAGLAVGDIAVNFTLKDIDGEDYLLSRLLGEKPVLMVFASFTWPPFRRQCAANDELYVKYQDQIHFIIIYTIEAHPGSSPSPYSSRESMGAYSTDEAGNPIRQPQTYQERLELARKTVAEEGIQAPVLVDEIDNPIWCTYGPAPNIAYLIGTDGTIFKKQGWFQAGEMELAIADYLTRYR